MKDVSKDNPTTTTHRLIAPDLATTFAVIALALVTLRSLPMTVSPHDFWWHLAEGGA